MLVVPGARAFGRKAETDEIDETGWQTRVVTKQREGRVQTGTESRKQKAGGAGAAVEGDVGCM